MSIDDKEIKDKHPGGRPTKYKPEYAEQAFKLCLISGATDESLAFFFDVTIAEIEKWVIEIPEFKQAILKAMHDLPEYERKQEARRQKKRDRMKLPHNREKANEYTKKRLKTDIQTRLRFNMASLIRGRLKSKNKTGIFRNLGYSVKELKEHLEKQFVDGMTWDNYGSIWHIDHITPDSWFNYESMDDDGFKQSWSLDNLQPLLKMDNLRKGNKYAG